jgi:hypothetical protein
MAAKGMGAVSGLDSFVCLQLSTESEVTELSKEAATLESEIEEGEKPGTITLAFAEKKTVALKDGDVLSAGTLGPITRAWYGEPGSEWRKGRLSKTAAIDFFGPAKVTGIDVSEEVMRLVALGEEVTAGSIRFKEKNKLDVNSSKVLVLETSAEHISTCRFWSKPLGIKFEKGKCPLVVVGFTAEALAAAEQIKIGWTLKSVNEQDLTGISYKDALNHLKEAQSILPDRGAIENAV